ncbi:centrosomal protein of 162 kDa isoform X2 [Poecilia reticulata]|uniref:centrosomal protein of 162 kDa isoform X2 n=1 Tax=Poecilia reticulata TaxID=8081 RepID=UPI0007E98F64|nr:PREDICTED: centrosomal protein of 162 kDa isoform X2 [Poecilia reticulata]
MSYRQTKEELDAEFEKFLQESVSDDSVDLGSPDKQPKTRSSQKSSQKPTVSWWHDDENNSGVRSDSHRKPPSKALDSHNKFDKILTAKTLDVSQSLERDRASPESQVSPTHETHQKIPERCPDEAKGIPAANTDGALLQGSIDESSKTLGGNMSAMGLDTLEEEEEKARFFAQIEAGASSAIDYSKLNRELDSSRSTFATELRKEDGPSVEPSATAEAVRESSAYSGSPQNSEEFEDEDGIKESQTKNSKLSTALARGQLYAQRGGSEVEDLQEAYRQIPSVKGCDGHRCLPLEDEGRTDRPVSPLSLPQHAQQSLQPFSTNDSDLPTAEELMRPIRAEDHTRGFTLPVSQELRMFPRVTPSELDLEQPGQSYSRTTEPPNLDLTSSIKKEVEGLMQEQNKHFPQTLSLVGNTKKKTTSKGSSVFLSCMLSERKLPLTPSRGRFGDSKAAGKMSKAAPTPKTPLSTNKSTKKQEQDSGGCVWPAETGVRVSSELVASVQSLVAVLEQQIHTSSLRHAVPQDCSCTQAHPQFADSSAIEALRAQLAHKEKELQMMKDDAEHVNSLRQQNYLLQSKLRSAEEANQRRWLETADPATEDKIQLIEKEMKEQEMLIKGYQQENEKLYVEMKAEQSRSKANQEAMFNENQGLLSQLAVTREQLRRSSRPVSNVCAMDHTKRISDLLAQINTCQNEARLCEENSRLEQENQSLQVELQLMKQEQQLAKAQTFSTSGGDEISELQDLQQQHREEVAALKNKLQWFAENQELLDRDAGRLKAATAEILQLKEQVENLKREVGKRSSDVQRKARDRPADTKRMQDLQQQVKELEQILRSRNPNSLPALIYAAATAAGGEKATSSGTHPPNTVNVLLERRIQRLESELESHDEEAKRTLRAIEQQFHQIKLRYEQQICELEQQLEQRQPPAAVAEVGSDAWMCKCQVLEEELRRVHDRHQQKGKRLQDQIESLQQQLKHKAQPSPGRHQHQAEAAFGGRIEWLNQELATKSRSIQELSRTVERLQRERRSMLTMPRQQSESHSALSRAQESAAAADSTQAGRFPAPQYEKTYQPSVFTGSHVSELQQENEALTRHVELLQQQSKQEKEELKANAVQSKEELCRLKEEFAEQLSCVKAEYLRVLERLQATHALEHSSSQVAELSNKLNSQEVAMKHLQQQLKELQKCKEALSISRRREEVLQKQLTRLLQELKEAKEAQSSEVKLLCSLERKIISMELRHEHREEELQQVVAETFQMSTADLQSEVERWRRLAQDKSRELDAFRSELDSILDILRHLQKQGAVLPALEPGHTARLL